LWSETKKINEKGFQLMTPQCHKIAYADRASWERVSILENVQVARDTFRIRFSCPKIGDEVLPGQFVMLRLAGTDDPLLGRPFAVYNVLCDSSGKADFIDVIYIVVGKMTTLLADRQAGSGIEIWGPLGNGFASRKIEHLVMVAGGIGQTPFLTLAQEYLHVKKFGLPAREVEKSKKVTLCYGVRNKAWLAAVEDFRDLGVDVRISTDDGSVGHHGFVTDLIESVVAESSEECEIACCGPEPMLQATSKIAEKLGLECQVSLENAMACGVGVCFSCVAKVRDTLGKQDYRRTCVDGPVFDAKYLDF